MKLPRRSKKRELTRITPLSVSHLLLFVITFGLIGIILLKSFAAPNPNLQGDLNGDNTVDATDLSILLSDFGTNKAEADINGDGTVDVLDLSYILSNYGQTYSGGGGGDYTPTYYVSNEGSDSNNGTSPSTPWKTISKVQNTCLNPGDVVAFEGGETFSDDYLDVKCSGTSANPIVFTSYGTGQAIIGDGVWFNGGHHDVVLDNLEITSATSAAVASCGSCSGNPVYDITINDSYIYNTPDVGVNTNTGDHDWLIEYSTIQHTGDSGIILYYSTNMTVTHNTITDTGWNTGITYGKHGIYAKSSDITISYNNFSDDTGGQAISIRAHGQNIYGNVIHDTPDAFAFFDYDESAPPQGTSYVYDNLVYNIDDYAFYYGGQTDPNSNSPSVSFVIANNTFVADGGEMFNLSEVPSGASIVAANNIFTGTFGSAYRGCATCTEHYDLWNGGTSNAASGANDIFADPKLNAAPALTLQTGSPAIDAGTTNVPGLTYTQSSGGQPLEYTGSAPDLGGVEY